jgi:hypothetical protein
MLEVKSLSPRIIAAEDAQRAQDPVILETILFRSWQLRMLVDTGS